MNHFFDLWAQAHIAEALEMEPKEIVLGTTRTLKTECLVSVVTCKFGLKAETKISRRVMSGPIEKAVKAYCAAIERIIKKLKAQLCEKSLSGALDKPEPAIEPQWPQWIPASPQPPQPWVPQPWVQNPPVTNPYKPWGQYELTDTTQYYRSMWGDSSK